MRSSRPWSNTSTSRTNRRLSIPDWAAHGYMDEAVALFEGWARERLARLPGATLEIVRLPGRTPLILIEVPGAGRRHRAALRPSRQAAGDGRLGRGLWAVDARGSTATSSTAAAAPMTAMRCSARSTALAALARAGRAACALRHPDRGVRGIRQLRSAVLRRPSGARGSARPSLVVCLDSGCGNYDQLWLTTSLRGIVAGTLERRGARARACIRATPRASCRRASASCGSCCRGSKTRRPARSARGALCPDPARAARAGASAPRRRSATTSTPNSRSCRARGRCRDDLTELVLNRTWRPQLAVTGIDGLPPPGDAGNVLLPFTSAKLSLRLPPTLDAEAAGATLQRLLRDATRPMARRSPSRRRPPRPAGTRRRSRRGSKPRWSAPPRRRSARRPPIWARAAASRSWRCSASAFRRRNSSSPACWARIPTRTAPTNSCTSRPARRITQVIAQVLADHHARAE